MLVQSEVALLEQVRPQPSAVGPAVSARPVLVAPVAGQVAADAETFI